MSTLRHIMIPVVDLERLRAFTGRPVHVSFAPRAYPHLLAVTVDCPRKGPDCCMARFACTPRTPPCPVSSLTSVAIGAMTVPASPGA